MFKVLFCIPIYLRSQEEHHTDMEQRKKNFLTEFRKSYDRLNALNHFDPKKYETWFYASDWYCWKYNEIVGYIEVYTDGKIMKAQKYFVNARRITKSLRKKRFKYCGKMYDIVNSEYNTNEQIATELKKFLKELSGKDKSCRRLYFDTSSTLNVINYIDFKRLLQ